MSAGIVRNQRATSDLMERRDLIDGRTWYTRWVGARESAPASTAPPLVLLQGLVISSTFHRPLMRELAGERHLYAPDIPGFGRSTGAPVIALDEQVDAIERWCTALGVEQADILGTSYGAQIAASFAAHYPQRVARLVLVSPMLEPAARPWSALMRRWMAEAPRELSMSPHLLRDIIVAGPRRSLSQVFEMRAHRLEQVAPRIDAPTLVVRGGRDPLVSRQWATRVTAMLRDGRLVEVPGARHPMNFTEPEVLARVIRTFLSDQYAD